MTTIRSITLTSLRVDQLRPNDWNPNAMTEDAYAELLAEVKHLGRVPKPVVVRPNGDDYEIVDGEHSWRAAKDANLSVVSCEVIKADDFESMRQTFKRNQHGKHNPLLEGRMWRRMLEVKNGKRRRSVRQLAELRATILR